MMEKFLNIVDNSWTKLIALLGVLHSTYLLSKSDFSDLEQSLKVLIAVVGGASFSTVLRGLFYNELSNHKEKRDADKDVFNNIIDLIPSETNFYYWFNDFDFGTANFSGKYLFNFNDQLEKFRTNKTLFFHDKRIQKKFKLFTEAGEQFWKTLCT